MATINTSSTFDQRIVTVAGDVPIDEETSLPVMSVTAWSKQWVRNVLVRAMQKAERKIYRNDYNTILVAENDIT
jgi:hypothetical protein